MANCLACSAAETAQILDLGRQPVASRLRVDRQADEVRHPLALAICPSCGTSQLAAPWPSTLLKPAMPLVYREPEAHLDAVVGHVLGACPRLRGGVVAGLSYKDDTTLARLAAAGVARTWRLDPAADLGVVDPAANIESLQAALAPARCAAIAAARGGADVVVVRHMLEHAERPRDLMHAAVALLNPGGHVLIEVPDCSKALRLADITMIWEEHALYFVPETLAGFLDRLGFAVVLSEGHPCPFEDLIVVLARPRRPGKAPTMKRAPQGSAATLQRTAERFAADAMAWATRYRDFLKHVRRRDGRAIALYGAGHLGTAFVNFGGLADLFAFVIDDTPEKQGRYLAGTNLPIVAADALSTDKVALCLLALSPALEDRIIAKNRAYTEAGGAYASIFAESGRSLRRHMELGHELSPNTELLP